MRFSLYGVIALGLLAAKFLAARKQTWEAGPALTTAVVIPLYNEDPEAFAACLRSVQKASPGLGEIWVVDDGSTDKTCLEFAWRASIADRRIEVVLLPVNGGKRHAMAEMFRKSTADIFITVDSDTVLAPDAIWEALKPFSDERVQGVTGVVRALNPVENLLTRLIDVRYASAFMLDRLAQSMFGSVLCACGSLALWRADLVRENLDDFVAQKFLGIPVQYGDDRRMTNYALLKGRVVVQWTALARTLVPSKINHFLRQQARWNRSFCRETFWALRHLSPRRPAWWLALTELASWALLSFGFTLSLTDHRSAWFVLGAVGVAYLRSLRYATEGGRVWLTFILGPLYAVLHFTLLLPVKLWAVCTLRNKSWGTREKVEVGL